jgi:hypothetical protein
VANNRNRQGIEPLSKDIEVVVIVLLDSVRTHTTGFEAVTSFPQTIFFKFARRFYLRFLRMTQNNDHSIYIDLQLFWNRGENLLEYYYRWLTSNSKKPKLR